MKKAVFMLFLSLSSLRGIAQIPSGFPGTHIALHVAADNPSKASIRFPRVPQRMPQVFLSGYVLYFENFASPCALTVQDAETTVFVTELMPDNTSCELPTSLSGAYTLVLKLGSVEYRGEIVL